MEHVKAYFSQLMAAEQPSHSSGEALELTLTLVVFLGFFEFLLTGILDFRYNSTDSSMQRHLFIPVGKASTNGH